MNKQIVLPAELHNQSLADRWHKHSRSRAAHGYAPRIVTLIAGTPDEHDAWTTANATVSVDTEHYKIKPYGMKITATKAGTADVWMDPMLPFDPLTFPPAQAVCMWFWIDDVAKIGGITGPTIRIYPDSGLSNNWSRGVRDYITLKNGWNFARIPAFHSTNAGWGTIYKLRLYFTANESDASITIGQLYLECPEKARILMMHDGGKGGFMDAGRGYSDMKARGWPLTIDLDPMNNHDPEITEGEDRHLTWDELVAIYNDGNGNAINLHGWNGTLNTEKTLDELLSDAALGKKYLQAKGIFRGPEWRGAFLMNYAPLESDPDYLSGTTIAQAFYDGTGGATIWPPLDRWNIRRYGIHNRTQEALLGEFERLDAFHHLLIAYTHYISDSRPESNMSPENWAYFLSLADARVRAGTLEFVTMADLLETDGLYADGFNQFRARF